jgi:hypothetical protein
VTIQIHLIDACKPVYQTCCCQTWCLNFFMKMYKAYLTVCSLNYLNFKDILLLVYCFIDVQENKVLIYFLAFGRMWEQCILAPWMIINLEIGDGILYLGGDRLLLVTRYWHYCACSIRVVYEVMSIADHVSWRNDIFVLWLFGLMQSRWFKLLDSYVMYAFVAGHWCWLLAGSEVDY